MTICLSSNQHRNKKELDLTGITWKTLDHNAGNTKNDKKLLCVLLVGLKFLVGFFLNNTLR